MIPHAKLIKLPAEVGEGGDVSDFFVRLGQSREDFLKLIGEAEPIPPPPLPVVPEHQPYIRNMSSPLRQRIDRIKRDVSIQDIVSRYVKLHASGNNLTGLCPFHEDHNPSLTGYPTTGTFYCYGCQKHGDVITFVREKEHLDFGQALDVLDSLRRSHVGEPSADK